MKVRCLNFMGHGEVMMGLKVGSDMIASVLEN